MRKIIDKTLTPPGGWRYRQPESGAVITAGDWNTLIERVKAHRLANNYPLGLHFVQEVEESLCGELPDGSTDCLDTNPEQAPKRKITLGDLRTFLQVMEKWVSSGAKFVPQEEAERRAGICSQCPMNQHVEGCFGCKGITALITTILGAMGTSYDAKLSGCQVCGCALRAAVHIPLSAQLAGTRGLVFPEHCWKATPPEESVGAVAQ